MMTMTTPTRNDYDFKVQIDPSVFNEVYLRHLDDMSRVQIAFGGGSSGKSWFYVGQRPVIDLMRGGRNYLICRAVARTIRTSVFEQMKRTIQEFNVSSLFDVNKSDSTITCINGYQALFVGLDDVEKIKSIIPQKGAITDILVEEATETQRSDIRSLMKRQRGGSGKIRKRLTLLFNPILKSHWIYDEYFKPVAWADTQSEYRAEDGSLSILKTWFEHNKFLTEQDKQDLLNETDKYYSDVYTWGNWGVLGNVIFTNWITANLNDPNDEYYLPEKERTNRRNGLDFGFSNDPAALWRSHYDKKRKRIYIFDDEPYETGLTNDVLAEQVLEKIGKEHVACDSGEPKSIRELRNAKVSAYAVKKGKDSVLHGIQWLQQHLIIVDKHCVNARNELSLYKWKEDKGGNVLQIPVDKNNHLIDAGRYAHEIDMSGGGILFGA